MNGSKHAAGRQDAAMALGLAPLTAAEEALLAGDDGWPWSTAGRCILCRLEREHTASCEQEKRVMEVLEERCVRPPTLSRPQRIVVCKDCCNQALGGHECLWRDLCWRDQESRRGACEKV